MSDFVQELRFVLRTLRKSPGFTAICVVTLALGIGSNTAIFGLLDQLLIRSLPVESPERLVVLDAPGPYSGSTHNNSEVFTPLSHPMFEGLRHGNSVFSGILAHVNTTAHLMVNGETLEVACDLVSGTFFPVLGVRAAAGRLLGPEDDRNPGAHPVAVLSHSFWTRRFGADDAVVGGTILVNGHPMTVVGVAERGFHGVEVGQSVDVFVPLMMQAQVLPTWTRAIGEWRVRWLTVMARLEEGVSVEEARAGINVLYRQLLREDLATLRTRSESSRSRFLDKRIELVPGGRGTSELRYQSQTPLVVLMGMVGLVLLIACANVANLLLVRASSRGRELALRVALGASRRRIARGLLLESVVLALAGGAVGIVLATWTSDLLLRALPFEGVTEVFTAEPDLRVALFAFVLSLVTGVAFGAAPSLAAGGLHVAPALKSDGGSFSRRSGSSRFRRALVVTEVAVSLLVLVAAGLFVRTLVNLRHIDPGFEPGNVLAFSVDPSLNGYDLARRRSVIRELVDELAAEPGVRSVSLAEIALMTNSTSSSTVRVEGYESKEDEDMNPRVNGVAPGFFSTMGIPLLSGRDFTDADGAETSKVAVVNEVFARYFFPSSDPVGRRLGFGRGGEPDITIIGVVRDGKFATLREESHRFVYVPYSQSDDLGRVTFYVRASLAPESLGASIHEVVARVDAALPVTDVKTLTAQIRESLFVERLVAALSVAFGCLATLLAAIGLYGLMSYAVSLRTREIGIRVALGAERGGLLLLVLKEVVLLVLLGVAVGLPAGYLLGPVVEAQLYGLSGQDGLSIAIATATLLATALLAGYVPAARASRVNPIVALRHE